MGLTIHYSLQTKSNNPENLLERLRQKALDLPFKEVGDIIDLKGDKADYEKPPIAGS